MRRAAISLVLATVVAGGGWGLWRVLAARATAARFSALAVCLAGGPERVAPEEASFRARRIHRVPMKRTARGGPEPSLVLCKELAEDFAASRFVRSSEPRLAFEADALAFGSGDGRPRFDLEALWRAAEGVPWRPPADLRGAPLARAPMPLLDAQLPEQRGRLAWATLPQDIDRQPFDRLVVATGGAGLVVVADADRLPLSVVARTTDASAPPRSPRGVYQDGRARVEDTAGNVLDLGPAASSPSLLDDVAVWTDETRIHARRVPDPATGGDARAAASSATERVLELPGVGPRSVRSCRSARGHALAVESMAAGAPPRAGKRRDWVIAVFRLRGDDVEFWGRVDRSAATAPSGSVGDWSLACDDTGVRLAWALSEPTSEAGLAGLGEDQISEGGAHHIVLAACTAAGCSRREARVTGIDAGWYTLGGYGSAWVMSNPHVFDLGRRVLVAWQGADALHYRLAPLEALEGTRSEWIAEVSRPREEDAPDPRTLSWPRMQVLTRGGVAIMALTEERAKTGPSFLVRFDDEGHAVAIDLPP